MPSPASDSSCTVTSQERRPRVYLAGTEGLVWDIQDVRKLRQDHRIAGSLAGSLPRSPMQNIFQGLPLRLLLEEIFVLHHHGVIDLIIDNNGSINQDESTLTPKNLADRSLVFEHLWKDHRFFVAPGMKFGGDYLLYRSDPLVCHASLVASFKEQDEPLSLTDLVNSARLVSTVQKQHLICSVLSPQAATIAETNVDVAAATGGVTVEESALENARSIPSDSSSAAASSSGSNRQVIALAVEWAGF
ncbi:hypothetical protein BGX33_005934 [Mortierella sp. NVP41]|nr:hypothetical protein BGX33_005934 [Mortierella sp. NVP41]